MGPSEVPAQTKAKESVPDNASRAMGHRHCGRVSYRERHDERAVLPLLQAVVTTAFGGYAGGILVFPGGVEGAGQASYERVGLLA